MKALNLSGGHEDAPLEGRFASAEEAGVMVGYPPAASGRVTLDNWLKPPYQRWSFLHTRELVPTAGIARGLPPVPLPAGSSVDLSWLTGFLDHSWTDGLLVLKEGRICYEAYRNGMAAATPHLTMSVTKSIVSLLWATLVTSGRGQAADLVVDHVPEMAGTAYGDATVEHLLDMRVASSWQDDLSSQSDGMSTLDVASGWAVPRPGVPGTLFELCRATRRRGAPGGLTSYASPNADLLGLIIERVAQQPLAQVASELLWQPLGAEFDADVTLDPEGTAVCDGGFCVALRDLGRIGMLLLAGGAVGSRQVIPEAWIDGCWTAPLTTFAPGSYGGEIPGVSYHNLWWRIGDLLLARGIHGQLLAVDRRTQLVVVLLSSNPHAHAPHDFIAQWELLQLLSRSLQEGLAG